MITCSRPALKYIRGTFPNLEFRYCSLNSVPLDSVFYYGCYREHSSYSWRGIDWQPTHCDVSKHMCGRLGLSSNGVCTPPCSSQILWYCYGADTPLFPRILGRPVICKACGGFRWASTELHIVDRDTVSIFISFEQVVLLW